MNRTYRTIWNRALRAWVAVSELGRRRAGLPGAVVAGAVLCAASLGAQAQSLYWDLNGNTAGAGGAAPSGTWDTSTANWNSNAAGTGGTLGAWAPNSTAVFSAGTDATGNYTVTVAPGGITGVAGVVGQEGTVTLTGGTIGFAPGASIGGNVIVNSAITGTDLALAGTLNLRGQINLSGTLTDSMPSLKVLSGNQITVGALNTTTGFLQIDNGARVTSLNTRFNGSGYTNQIVGAATVVNSGATTVGDGAAGNLAVSSGATLNATTLRVGVGASGTVLTGGGGVIAANDMILAAAPSSSATLVLNGNSVLAVGSLSAGQPGARDAGTTVTTNVIGGELRATRSNTAFVSGFVNNEFNLSGPLTLNSNGFDIGIQSPMTGVGRLIKTGAGTATLTSANTYSGGTTIDAGTLQIGAGGTSGSIVGNVVNNGLLSFRRSDAVSFGGAISGAGGVTVDDFGTVTLTGTNSYSGGTSVLNGTLVGSTTSIQGHIENYGTVSFQQASAGTYAGDMTGFGSLIKSNAGTLSLTGTVFEQTYPGNHVIIDGGTLQVGNGGSAGELNANVLNNATLAFNRSDAVAFDGTISGSGNVVKQGAGTLTLGGDNSYAGGTDLKTGTLAVASDTALGSGDLRMDDGTTLAFAANGLTLANAVVLTGLNDPVIDTGSFSATLAGAISGGGFLTKQGSGVLTLSGANTYSGATDVAQGTLRAGATNTLSAASAHSVAAGATLDLAGFDQRIAALANNGTVSLVGSAPGTSLTVTGPYVGNNATLRLATALGNSASASDRLVLDGAGASASGRTTVQVTNLGGLGAQTTGNGIEVVAARGGATTTAQTTRDAFALANGHVDAGAFEYRLQAADANGAGESWYLRSSTTAVPSTPPSSQPTAAPAPAPVVTYRQEVPLFAALPSQLRQADLGMLGDRHKRIGDDEVASTALGALSPDGGERRAWGRVIATRNHSRQEGSVSPESEGTLTGFQAGTDLLAQGPWRAGVYVGQLDGDMATRGFASGTWGPVGSNSLQSRFLGGYATWQDAATGFYVDTVLQAGRHRVEVEPLANPRARTEGSSLSASLEAGRSFALGDGGVWRIEPQLQIVRQHLDLDVAQLGGARVASRTDDSWLGRAGVRVKGRMSTAAGTLQPYARVNLYRASEGADVASFIGPAATTEIRTATGSVSAEAAGGFTLQLTPATTLYGEAGKLFELGGASQQQSSALRGSLGLRVRW